MDPYSYFLPKTHMIGASDKDGGENDGNFVNSVFSHSFEDIYATFASVSNANTIYLSDNGQSITLNLADFTYKAYHISDSNLISSKTRMSEQRHYDQRLYDCKIDLCYIFKSKIVDSDEKKSTQIHISYVIPNESDEWQLFEDALVLEYEHVFNRYYCFLSHQLRKIVILTGHYQYGFRKSHLELRDTHLHVISYTLQENSLNINFHEDSKRNVTDARRSLMGNYFDKTFFTVDGSKLILLSTKEQLLVVYSLTSDTFGDVYSWTEYYDQYYAYNKHYGDLFFLCNKFSGHVRILVENNLNMQLLEKESFSLQELGYPTETFRFWHVDYFDNIILYAVTKPSNNLIMIDCLQKKLIGTYSLRDDQYIIAINTNWSGEEVFILFYPYRREYELEILYNNKKLSLRSLRDAAKLAVLQVYSVDTLKNMNLPKMLKSEFYSKIYQ